MCIFNRGSNRGWADIQGKALSPFGLDGLNQPIYFKLVGKFSWTGHFEVYFHSNLMSILSSPATPNWLVAVHLKISVALIKINLPSTYHDMRLFICNIFVFRHTIRGFC